MPFILLLRGNYLPPKPEFMAEDMKCFWNSRNTITMGTMLMDAPASSTAQLGSHSFRYFSPTVRVSLS